MYTGLLDYVHAAAMSVLGVHLLTPRVLMFVAVMLWIPAVWSIGRTLTAIEPGRGRGHHSGSVGWTTQLPRGDAFVVQPVLRDVGALGHPAMD
jgi:hypothetical protein